MIGNITKLYLFLSLLLSYHLHCVCGGSATINPANDPRVVGGSPAVIENTKHQVSLRYKLEDERLGFGRGHICGGSFITPITVLTAAHCVTDDYGTKLPASRFIIVAGTLDRMTRTADTIVRNVREVIVHQYYNGGSFSDDVALLILDEAIPKDLTNVQPIPLASTPYQASTLCAVTGWGTIIYEGPSSAILLTVNVTINSKADCISRYGTSTIVDGMLCAGDPLGGKDACQGDSGGPLVCNGILTGVVSTGVDCGLPQYPGIYSDVYYFRNWIAQFTQADDDFYALGKAQDLDALYHASIRGRSGDLQSGNGYMCSGVLISVYHVLTSAECVYNNNFASALTVALGTKKRVLNMFETSYYSYNVSNITIHEKFNVLTKENNLALLKLERSVILVPSTIDVIDYRKSAIPSGSVCTVSGWMIRNSTSLPNDLQILKTSVYDSNEEKCRATSSEYVLSNGTLCAGSGSSNSTSDTCFGFEGAPMVCNSEVVGIVSFQGGCGRAGAPIIYTNLFAHRQWLEDNTTGQSNALLPSVLTLLLSIIIVLIRN